MNSKLHLALALAWLGLLDFQACGAEPEIAHVFPDFPTEYPNASPHMARTMNIGPLGALAGLCAELPDSSSKAVQTK